MIPILYESNETTFASNGLGRLRDCISCEVTNEKNGVYECDFEYPITGTNYNEIREGRIIYCDHDDTGDCQPFDIVGRTRPINGIVTFHAVHVSYRLAGIVYPEPMPAIGAKLTETKRTPAQFWTMFRQHANPPMNNSNKTNFQFESDITSSAIMTLSDNRPYNLRELLGGVEGSLLDAFHCEYVFDNFNVKALRSAGQKRDFTIRYGVNMTDFNDESDYSGTYNAAVPYWKGDNNGAQVMTVFPISLAYYYVNSGVTGYNGRTVCAPIDISDQFETMPTTAQAKQAALNYMNNNKTYTPARTIEVKFVRLQDSPEYAEFAPLMKCELYDTVHVEFPRYGVSGDYKVVKTVWDVLQGRFIEMELGNLSTTLSEALGVSSGGNGSGSGGSYTTLADRIISKGSSGNWKWQKWASGKIEAWGTASKSVAITTTSAAYGGYRSSSEITFDIPSGIFGSTPGIVLAQKNGSNSARVMNMRATSATQLAGYFASAESVTLTCSMSFYVVSL